MTESPRCAHCGHELGRDPYCTGCGRPVEGEWRTDTAERPPVVPPTVVAPGGGVPPPAFEPPPKARYPLFADQSGPDGAGQAPPTVAVSRKCSVWRPMAIWSPSLSGLHSTRRPLT